MACYLPIVRFPLACLLAALGAGCMQGPQAAVRPDAAAHATVQARCPGTGHTAHTAHTAQWQAMEQELRAQGLAVRVHCAGAHPTGVLQLVVLDSVRASEVLRGPLADGESVELGLGTDASPDVQFNRAWLEHALMRHQGRMATGAAAVPAPLAVDFAVR